MTALDTGPPRWPGTADLHAATAARPSASSEVSIGSMERELLEVEAEAAGQGLREGESTEEEREEGEALCGPSRCLHD